MISRDLLARSCESDPEYDVVIILIVGSIVHIHAGNITEVIVDLEDPGGTLIIMSFSFSSLRFTRSPAFCNSSHMYFICLAHTGASGIITSQNSCTNLYRLRRHNSAVIVAGFSFFSSSCNVDNFVSDCCSFKYF